jgi:hypothetical protein
MKTLENGPVLDSSGLYSTEQRGKVTVSLSIQPQVELT